MEFVESRGFALASNYWVSLFVGLLVLDVINDFSFFLGQHFVNFDTGFVNLKINGFNHETVFN